MTVYLYAPDGKNPSDHNVTGRVIAYALEIEDCTHLAIENLRFWASNFKAENVGAFNLTSNILKYHSTSRRMLGLAVIPDMTYIHSKVKGRPYDLPSNVFNNTF